MKYQRKMAIMSLDKLVEKFKENVTLVNNETPTDLGIIKWNSKDKDNSYLEKAVSLNETAGLLLDDWVEGTKNWCPCNLNKEGFLKDLIEDFFGEESKTLITEEAWTKFPKVITEAFELIERVS